MKLEHAALWATDLEASLRFYTRYFGARPGPRYANPATGFRSYFLRFDAGSRLELMQMPGISPRAEPTDRQSIGLVHLAFEAGDPASVDALTAVLRRDGHAVVGAPRRTGDGYYESTVLDPDGNRIEIVATAEA
jgi:lactoylglutathione lyase